MRRLALKAFLFAAVFLGTNVTFGTVLHVAFADRFDPRHALFHRIDRASFDAVLAGDSVFGSYYVDREDQTLWAVLERETGLRTLPGALNGARGGDLLLSAELLAARLRSGTLVFVDVAPTSSWRRDERRFAYEFLHYGGYALQPPGPVGRKFAVALRPLLSHMLLWEDMPLVSRMVTRAPDFRRGNSYDRRWNDPPDFARERFAKWLETFRNGLATRDGDLTVLREIHDVLLRAGHRPVFVLSPFNEELVRTFAAPHEASAILAHLEGRHARTVGFLHAQHLPFVDLFGAVPSDGFADFLHTNAKGDGLIAHAMAGAVAWHASSH